MVRKEITSNANASDDSDPMGPMGPMTNILKAVIYVVGDSHRSIGTDGFIPGWGVKVAAKESNLEISLKDISIATPSTWKVETQGGGGVDDVVPKELMIKAPALIAKLSSNKHEGLKDIAEGAGFAEFLCLEILVGLGSGGSPTPPHILSFGFYSFGILGVLGAVDRKVVRISNDKER